MKRITLALWVLFLSLCIVEGAMAARSTKPQAEMCFTLLPSPSLRMTLVINPTGAVTMADGSTPFYAINGVLFNPANTSIPPPWAAPISGTGYMQKWGDYSVFTFSVTGSTYLNAVHVSVDVLGYYLVMVRSGSIHYLTSDGFHSEYPIFGGACDTVTIPIPVD